MSRQYQWAEEDFDLPYGVQQLGLSEPVSGRTYVMYHGTTKQNAMDICFTGFRQSSDGILGRGVYLSRDREKASRYPLAHLMWDKVVIEVEVNVGRVKAIDRQRHPLQKTWHDYGYDMAWVPPDCGMVWSGLEKYCVWDPDRIKIIDVIHPRIPSSLVDNGEEATVEEKAAAQTMAVIAVAAVAAVVLTVGAVVF